MQAPLADTFRLVAQVVIEGGVVSTTVMSAVHVVLLLAASLTVMVTVVVLPSASAVLAAGLCVIVNEPEAVQLSVATISPVKSGMWPVQVPLADTFRLVAQVVIEGALVSCTVTVLVVELAEAQTP